MKTRLHSYVYKITQKITGYFYIGVTSSNKSFQEHLGIRYFTSGCLREGFLMRPSDFTIELLLDSTCRATAELYESLSIYESFDSPLNMNFAYNYKLVEFPKKSKSDKMWDIYWKFMTPVPVKKAPKVKTARSEKPPKLNKSGQRQTVWSPTQNKYVPVTAKMLKKVRADKLARKKAEKKKPRW